MIVPCYNAAAFVVRAIECLLAQTYPSVEIIVINDASPDSDALLVALEPYLSRIRYHAQEHNQGVSVARNTGAHLATGEIVSFLDADDWWPENFLTELVPQVEKNCAVYYDSFVVHDTEPFDWRQVNTENRSSLFDSACWKYEGVEYTTMDRLFDNAPIPKLILMREDYLRIGGMTARFQIVEDYYFLINAVANKIRMKTPQEPKGFYYHHQESTMRHSVKTREKQAMAQWVMSEVIKSAQREFDLTPAARRRCRMIFSRAKARFVKAALLHYLKTRTWLNNVSIVAALSELLLYAPELTQEMLRILQQRIPALQGRAYR